MTSIYLAGRYDRRAELATYATHLEALGYTVTARWLDGGEDDTSPAALKQYAQIDLDDIDAADWFVCFLDTPDAGYLTGGKHVELGFALAKGKLCYGIGKGENVFHLLMPCFSSWQWFLSTCRQTKAGIAA